MGKMIIHRISWKSFHDFGLKMVLSVVLMST